jgi:HEAT repeats
MGVSRRVVCGALAATIAAALVAGGRFAAADEPRAAAATALRDVMGSNDFRIRVNAALFLGKARPPGAREALEGALDDAHPAVRIAAASALATLGDPAALPALQRRLEREQAPGVRAQLESTLEPLRLAAAQPSGGRHGLSAGARVVVRLGTMRNNSGIRGDELRRVLHEATRSRARALRGADYVAETDAPLLAQAAARHLPVVTLDGLLTRLTESQADGSLEVHAAVEFAFRREQELRGILSGAATTFGTSQTISDQGRRRLQDDAVDGAVQSALRGAEGLLVAVR